VEILPGSRLHWTEIACRDRRNTPYPLDWREDPTRLPALVRAFRDVRDECTVAAGMDCPLAVLEGYRTEAYQEMLRQNPRYRAAKNSQHCQGRALDIACPRLLSFDEFTNAVRRAASRPDSPIRYVELRPSMNYIHFDVRPTKRLVEETVP
jgi:uncharacterized protein YcbK (DUF882 family)